MAMITFRLVSSAKEKDYPLISTCHYNIKQILIGCSVSLTKNIFTRRYSFPEKEFIESFLYTSCSWLKSIYYYFNLMEAIHFLYHWLIVVQGHEPVPLQPQNQGQSKHVVSLKDVQRERHISSCQVCNPCRLFSIRNAWLSNVGGSRNTLTWEPSSE